MQLSITQQAFLALLRAGLWENAEANLSLAVNLNDRVDWGEVYKLAEEQSVIGVVLAGLEHSNVKPPQELLLQWIGAVQMLEQHNKSMNHFIADKCEGAGSDEQQETAVDRGEQSAHAKFLPFLLRVEVCL